MKYLKFTILICIISIAISACKSSIEDKPLEVIDQGLKEVFKDDFTIGAAINSKVILNSDAGSKKIILDEFNTITPENLMKWENIHPEKEVYNFDLADKFIEFGQQNNLQIIGHTLVWHSQLADYVKQVKDKLLLKQHIQSHIETIVNKYKGKVDAWDVVNEALNEDGSYRTSHFYTILEEEYLAHSFRVASETDTNADLLYNDYNLYKPEKRGGVVRLVKMLQSKNIKIDGIGMQGHWGLATPSLSDIEASIIAFSNVGMKVSITELDITVLPNPWDLEGADVNQNFEEDPLMNPYQNELPDSISNLLANRYAELFTLFRKHRDKIDRITFWGVNDSNSWLNNWPIKNRVNYPLLFNRQFEKKKAYYSVKSIAKNIKQIDN